MQQDAEASLEGHFASIQSLAQTTTVPQLLQELSQCLDSIASIEPIRVQLRSAVSKTAAALVRYLHKLNLTSLCWQAAAARPGSRGGEAAALAGAGGGQLGSLTGLSVAGDGLFVRRLHLVKN